MNKLLYSLTKEEKAAISKLKKLAQIWPESLWLFSNGTLYVMKTNGIGEKERAMTQYGGVDPKYIVDTIDIPNDGGDW
jgi:hypothetical protein